MRDLARVGVYLKPYMARVARILIVVAAMSCIIVVEPYLTKIMIDVSFRRKTSRCLACWWHCWPC